MTYGQITCNEGRYQDSLFDVTITSNLLYGNNVNYAGVSTDLYLDVYEPAGDILGERPLIIFAPKGSFIAMDKNETSMVQLCTRFAQMGYVCASIQYRVGVNYMAVLADPEGEFTLAVLRAAHDYKAAIRYFRKDAETSNTFRIDTSMIIAGGSSAGAITALHVAYLNKESEIPAGFDTTGLGGQEGLSGNPGYSSKVHAVVNLCGALADSSWIEPSDLPLISMHGNLDTEVPYGTAMISVVIPIMEVDGSASLYDRCMNMGVHNDFYTFWGQAHIPYDENAAGPYLQYMDTVVTYVQEKLYPIVCDVATWVPESKTEQVLVYPNPAHDRLWINGPEELFSLSIIDLSGRTIAWSNNLSGKTNMDISSIKTGVYFVRIESGTETTTERAVILKD